MRRGLSGSRGDHHHLRNAGGGELFQQAGDGSGAIAEPVCFAAPEAVAGEGDRMRIESDGRRECAGGDLEQVIAAAAGQVERFRHPLPSGQTGDEIAAVRLAGLGRPVKLMLGGMTGWMDEGFAVASGTEPGL